MYELCETKLSLTLSVGSHLLLSHDKLSNVCLDLAKFGYKDCCHLSFDLVGSNSPEKADPNPMVRDHY
jgi:hypothetical protein